MPAIQVEAARIPDRDELLVLLRGHGLEARPEHEVGIVVDGGSEEVFATVEELIMRIGAPFVPIKHDAVIYVRPPVG